MVNSSATPERKQVGVSSYRYTVYCTTCLLLHVHSVASVEGLLPLK